MHRLPAASTETAKKSHYCIRNINWKKNQQKKNPTHISYWKKTTQKTKKTKHKPSKTLQELQI